MWRLEPWRERPHCRIPLRYHDSNHQRESKDEDENIKKEKR